MSYIINDDGAGADHRRRQRRVWLLVGAVLLVALLVAAFLAGRGAGSGAHNEASPVGPGEAPITWSLVGGEPAPSSALHGPTRSGNGLASGFSHDELGAVLAAINISLRITGEVGPAVYGSTLRLQCIGDIDATFTRIQNTYSTSLPGAAVATEYFYQITKGDPSGDVVVVSIAATSPQATAAGGYAGLPRTLQWIDEDWKLQVPAAPPQLVPSITNYTSLGPVDA